jgi:hypothetical protein
MARWATSFQSVDKTNLVAVLVETGGPLSCLRDGPIWQAAPKGLSIQRGPRPFLGQASTKVTMDTYGYLLETPEEDVSLFEKSESDLMVP